MTIKWTPTYLTSEEMPSELMPGASLEEILAVEYQYLPHPETLPVMDKINGQVVAIPPDVATVAIALKSNPLLALRTVDESENATALIFMLLLLHLNGRI